jgi:hypothetical protein
MRKEREIDRTQKVGREERKYTTERGFWRGDVQERKSERREKGGESSERY